MREIKLSIVGNEGNIKKERQRKNSTYLDYKDEYVEGDKIVITVPEKNVYLMVQLDEALSMSLIYLKENTWEYKVPTDTKLRKAYSPKVFSGAVHYISARYATKEEIIRYQNLAFNPHDQKNESGAYPHAFANVETRDESTFFARNAIDGVLANEYHGKYPFQSWGINQQKDAELTIDFGRTVEIDKVAIVLRGDYPHDSYWTQATLEFSDGTVKVLELEKVLDRQYFDIEQTKVEWIKFKDLIKAEDESPFPALTQIEFYGKNII